MSGMLSKTLMAAAVALVLSVMVGTVRASAMSPGNSYYYSQDGESPVYTSSGVPAQYSQQVAAHTWTANGVYPTSYVTSIVWEDPSTGDLAFGYVFQDNDATTQIFHATINDSSNPWATINIVDGGAGGIVGQSTASSVSPNWSNGDPDVISIAPLASGGYPIINFENPNNFAGTILDGSTGDYSSIIWLATNATQYTTTNVALSDGGTSGNVTAYAPVPEPASLALVAFSGVLLACRRRHRRA